MSILGQIQVRSTTFHPLPRNLEGVCGYLPDKSRPYFYAQSTALDLLCQDLSSDPKNIYVYFIKYCIKVKYLGKCQTRGQSPKLPLNPFPGVARGAAGAFPTRLDPIIVRNRQLSTSSVRIYHQIQNIFTFKLSNIALK